MFTSQVQSIRLTAARLRQRIRGSANAQRILWNMGWLTVDKLYSTALGVVVGILVARYLGIEGFGLLNYALAFVALFQVPASLGLEEVLVRELVRFPESRNEILGTAFVLRLIGGLLTMGLIALAVRFVQPGDPYVRMIVMVASLANIGQSAMLINRWNNSQLRAKHNVLAANLSATATAAVRLALVYVHAALIWFVWINVIGVILNVVLLAWLYQRSGERIALWRARRSWASQMLRDAWPRVPSGIAGSVQRQLGALIIGTVLGKAELGAYSVAYRIYVLLWLVPDILCQSLVPTLTQAHAISREFFQHRLTQAYRLMLALFLASVLPVLVMGLWGIRLLYGQQYAAAGPLLIYMLVPLFLVYLAQLRMWSTIIDNLFHYSMYLALVLIPLSILANYLLIRLMGSLGAVLAMAIPSLFVFAADFLFYQSHASSVIRAFIGRRPGQRDMPPEVQMADVRHQP